MANKKIKKLQVSPSKRKDGKRWFTVAIREEQKAKLNELAKFHDKTQSQVLEEMINGEFEKALASTQIVN